MIQEQSIESIFCSAVEIESAEERDAHLRQVCGDDAELRKQVDRLLIAHFQGGSILDAPPHGLAVTVDQPLTEKPGTRIGPYKLLQQIGEGGFGVVYMAEQLQPVRRKVALKIIKPGMDSKQVVARFEAERQALALMDHPNIARVFDGGATQSGRPYFVMELVRGVPLTEYCDKNHLSTTDRLKLFVDVCRAVQHAHHRGIVHRDLKPANVMVTLHDGKPVPKVIDFGVSKALNQQLTEKTIFTNYGQMMGTPAYMSPEQAEMSGLDIDTRSDVYSLGVLLFELLTGSTPFESERLHTAGYAEMLRIIQEEDPPTPSTRLTTQQQAETIAGDRGCDVRKLSQIVRGELDWIVMTALKKDRTDRYETAASLAADVERYLTNETVQACPPTLAYRLRKFVRRNKTACAVGAALIPVLSAIIFGAIVVLHAARERERRVVRDAEATQIVQGLLKADTSQVDVIIGQLSDYREMAEDDLQRAFAESEEDSKVKLHAALALLQDDDSVLPFLQESLLAVAPVDFAPVRSLLDDHQADVTAAYWQIVQDDSQDPDRRFHAACALASFDTENENWLDRELTHFVAGHLVSVLPSELLSWRNALRPVRQHLIEPLSAIYRDDQQGVHAREFATDALADFLSEDADRLFDLLADANARQFGPMFDKLVAHREQAIQLAQAELRKKSPPVPTDWTVRFHAWEPDGNLQPPADWDAVRNSPVLSELRLAPLNLRGSPRSAPPAKQVPSQHFATIATTEVTLEDAEYSLRITFDDGVRVWLDDRQIFENWDVNVPLTRDIPIQARPGRHTLKVEHFQNRGEYALQVDIQVAEHVKDKLAMRQANSAITLLRMNTAEDVWPLLKYSPDPLVRSYIIHWLAPRGGEPNAIITRYEQEADVSIKRALLLCLGEFNGSQFSEEQRQPLIHKLLNIYRENPDRGLHAAAEWTLRQWGQGAKIAAEDKELRQTEEQVAALQDNQRQWYLNGQGQTFVVLDADEVRSDRRIAISSKEVTRAQWRVFAKEHEGRVWSSDQSELERYLRTDDSPMIMISWCEAAWYCNWLSQQEGIPQEQWCYEPNDKGSYGPGMKAKQDFWKLSGYRLPTEVEWSSACRAGTNMTRYYGHTDTLLPHYAWHQANSENYAWPVAGTKPNDFGLFDMLGNATEFISSLSGAPIGPNTRVKNRGGSFLNQAFRFNSVTVNSVSANRRFTGTGFRPARTLHLSPAYSPDPAVDSESPVDDQNLGT